MSNRCVCCPNFVAATSVATAEGITTITVPSTFNPTVCNCYCLLIRTSIPNTTECNSVVVTNGTVTWPILVCDGNNYRPCQLKCRSVLKLRYLSDPAHFLLEKVKR